MDHKIVRWAGAACVHFALSANCLAQDPTKAELEVRANDGRPPGPSETILTCIGN